MPAAVRKQVSREHAEAGVHQGCEGHEPPDESHQEHAWQDGARRPLPEATLAKPWHYEVERQGLCLLVAVAAVTHSMIGV
jgi:hypothetical protein